MVSINPDAVLVEPIFFFVIVAYFKTQISTAAMQSPSPQETVAQF